jgi:hypothetical protein
MQVSSSAPSRRRPCSHRRRAAQPSPARLTTCLACHCMCPTARRRCSSSCPARCLLQRP